VDLSRFNNDDFDRGAPLWKEALWRLCQGFFFQPLWHMPSSIRVFWLRLFGARVGQRVVIRAGVNISFPWRLELGDDVWLGEEVMILSLAPVRLAGSVCVSQRAFLCTGTHNWRSVTFDLKTAPITVEPGTWIGSQAFIGPGVVVGGGSVVSAGSVVLRSCPPNSFLRGNPASVEPIDRK